MRADIKRYDFLKHMSTSSVGNMGHTNHTGDVATAHAGCCGRLFWRTSRLGGGGGVGELLTHVSRNRCKTRSRWRANKPLHYASGSASTHFSRHRVVSTKEGYHANSVTYLPLGKELTSPSSDSKCRIGRACFRRDMFLITVLAQILSSLLFTPFSSLMICTVHHDRWHRTKWQTSLKIVFFHLPFCLSPSSAATLP